MARPPQRGPWQEERKAYVLLCRHGRHRAGRLLRDDPANGQPGQYPIEGVAERLREELVFRREMRLVGALVAPTPESRQTARALLDRLSTDVPIWSRSERIKLPSYLGRSSRVTAPGWARTSMPRDLLDGIEEGFDVKELEELSPAIAPEPPVHCVEQKIAKMLREAVKGQEHRAPAVLVVGHMPQLGWLSEVLHRPKYASRLRVRSWLRGAIPLASGEVACIAVHCPRPDRVDQHLAGTDT